MKIVVDMNLSPLWVGFLVANGLEAVHWTSIGSGRAEDVTVMEWARKEGYVVFTHDLDFSALIALAGASGSSVLQVRTQDVLPDDIGPDVLSVIRRHADNIIKGAIVSIDEVASRVRMLPIIRRLGDEKPG